MKHAYMEFFFSEDCIKSLLIFIIMQAISLSNRRKRYLPQKVKKEKILNLGSVLQYKHYTITIFEQKKTVANFNDIQALYVYNKHQEELGIFHGSSKRNLYGYGKQIIHN